LAIGEFATGTGDQDIAAADLVKQAFAMTRIELGRTIVGLEDVIEQVFITLLCEGHCMLEGAPGVAKTKLISTLSSLMDLSFNRIQFTPDLMPGDITGSEVLEQDPKTGSYQFDFKPGPLFASVVLADEINRTPPKTQSALLEAMEERQVTVGGKLYPLPRPFFVLATQNPIEHEGTYNLPEAQLDRFLMKIVLGYPSESDEQEIVRRACETSIAEFNQVVDLQQLQQMQRAVLQVPTGDQVIEHATRIIRATRPVGGGSAAQFDVGEYLQWGAGPRATIALVKAAKARALVQGRYHATRDDVDAVVLPVLRHRVMPTFSAEAEGITADEIVKRVVEGVPRG
jgi:MoxR-like ATPase